MDSNKLTVDLAEHIETNNSTAPGVKTNEYANLTLWQSVKKWKKVSWYCFGLTSAIILYGYDYVIVGTASAMPSFQRDFGKTVDGELILPSLWLAVWDLASPGTGMLGSIAGGWWQDKFGRRSSLAVGSFLSAVGAAISFTSNLPSAINSRRGLFLAGKGVQGGAIGMVMATAQTYMSEVLPPNLRGPILAFFPIFTLVGQLVGAAVVYGCLSMDDGYRVAFATQWAFSAVPLVMAFIAPESPTYLIRKGQEGKAYKAQKRLDADGIDTEQAMRVIREILLLERSEAKATYWDSFNRKEIRRTIIVMFASCLPQIFGLSLLAKASYFAQVVGMDPDVSVIVLILGLICGLVANLSSVWILANVGRRRLILVSLAVLVVLWLGMGICGIWSGTVTVWYTAATLIAVVIAAGLGVWPASYVVSSETSALRLRAKAQGIGWFVASAASSLAGFVLPYIYNPDQGDFGAKTGFVFSALCLIGWVVSYYIVPEMKGRTPAEIDRMFEQRLSAKSFRHWTANEDICA